MLSVPSSRHILSCQVLSSFCTRVSCHLIFPFSSSVLLPLRCFSESDQEKNEIHKTGTLFPKDFRFLIYLLIPARVMMNTAYKAALEILLFNMKIDNAGSCPTLLAVSTKFRAVPLSLK